MAPTTLSFLDAELQDGSSPSPSTRPAKNAPNALPDDIPFSAIIPTSFDIREKFYLVGLLILLSPVGLNFFAFYACMAILVGSHAVPRIIRLRYPRFMEDNILDDLRPQAGSFMSLIASVTAVLLQSHNTSISLAVKFHSEFHNRPLVRLLRTLLLAEVMHNGTSEEKEQIASWLRWIHRHIHGVITNETREELGIPVDIEAYGYIEELKAYIMYTLTWATIAFQTRFGRPLSKQGKDAIVLEYACEGLRIGIPEELLSKDYESFLISLDKHLDILESGHPLNLTRSMVQNIETSAMTAKMNVITRIIFRVGLMIGFDLLPPRVRDKYQLKVLSTWWQCFIQKVLISVLWFFYPMLMWLPLRGSICLLLILEPQLKPVFRSSLQIIHSMDILSDKPAYSKAGLQGDKSNREDTHVDFDLPACILWLDSGREGRTFLQRLLVRVLHAQLLSSARAHWSLARIAPWIRLSAQLAALIIDTMRRSLLDTVSRWNTQIKESIIFNGDEIKIPRHIGFVMDGNRRYARNLGQPIIVGHQHGAQTAGNVLEWWLRFMPNTAAYSHPGPGPQYLTVWAFSAENFKRPVEEVDGLFHLMAAEFKSLAFTSFVHLFQIRIRVVGRREGLPRELLDAVELLEETTRKYSRLFLQIAVGYGGRDEIVRSVQSVLARGEEVTEDSITQGTFCSQIGVPPVELIVRTSERRTSGFFLWDTQTTELHFVDKLWPQLTEGDWLDAIASFAKREMRNGR